MIVVLRAQGLRFFIFVDDHEPAHIHVRGNGQGKITLVGADGLPEFTWSKGMTFADRRRALSAARAHQIELLNTWREIHGGTN